MTKGRLYVSRLGKVAAAALLLLAPFNSLSVQAAVGLLPPPGSYNLDHIQHVPQAIVLEGTRFPHLLSSYTKGAVTLLAFFYSSCADPNGCPRAWEAFERLRNEIIARPALHGKVRLVFLSLDPARDTPDVLSGFARHYKAANKIVPWHFLTTYSYLFLSPLLREMGEEIVIGRGARGGGADVINHLLKVFLIDKEGWVREIYSNQSLDPAAMLGDIETLLAERAAGGHGND